MILRSMLIVMVLVTAVKVLRVEEGTFAEKTSYVFRSLFMPRKPYYECKHGPASGGIFIYN